MRVLVVEDEKLAAERLIELIRKCNPSYTVVDRLDSIEATIEWFKNNDQPDLLFLDIHLADGNAFDIFKSVEITSPIIFTTAYDQYAIKAFKVNSIDYLLKPIDYEDLKAAINKFEVQKGEAHNAINTENLNQLMESFGKSYKSRFVTKVGEHLHAIEVENIHFFYSEEKATYLQTTEGKKFIIDFPLDKVESMIDPQKFFRISRKYLVSFPSIKDMLSHSNSRLRLILANCNDDDVIVSRERVGEFKGWLDR